jgi:hypothetical protein
MKSLVKVVAVTTVLAVPAISFAQSSQPLTRAEVKAQLAQLEEAGYNANDYANYPANLQHAEIVLAEQHNGITAYGPVENGTSQSGK